MSQSLVRIIGHLIFSTKNREPLLLPEVRPALYGYMAGILKEAGCAPILIGGTEDHVHVLCGLSRNLAPCQIVQQLKESPSRWLKTRHQDLQEFHWQISNHKKRAPAAIAADALGFSATLRSTSSSLLATDH